MKKIIKTVLTSTTCISLLCSTGIGVYALENEESTNSEETTVEQTSPIKIEINTNNETTEKQPVSAEETRENSDELEDEKQPVGYNEAEMNSSEISALESPDLEYNEIYSFRYIYIDSVSGQILKEYVFEASLSPDKIRDEQVPDGYGLEPTPGMAWGPGGTYTFYVQKESGNYEGDSDYRDITIRFVDAQSNELIGERKTSFPSKFEYVTDARFVDGFLFLYEEGYFTNESIWKIKNDSITVHVQKIVDSTNEHRFSFNFLSDSKIIKMDGLVFEELDINKDNKIDSKELKKILPQGYQLDNVYNADMIFFELCRDNEGDYVKSSPDLSSYNPLYSHILIKKVEDPSDTDSSDDQTDTSNSDESREDNNLDNTKKETSVKEVSSQQKEKSTKTAYGTNPIIWTGLMSLALVIGIGMIARYKSKSNS